MKRAIVGTLLGSTAAAGRSRGELIASALARTPERAAMHANDLIGHRLLIGLCPTDGGFLDVGAHIGSIFSEVHRRDPTIRIFAVEADSDKAARLERDFPYCTLFSCAVGEDDGEATFFRDADRPGYNSLVALDGGDTVTVPIRRLDDLLPDAKIDVVKIDIEGAELGALRGGRALIERCLPSLYFESVMLGRNSLGYAPEDLWDWFDGLSYQILTPDRVAHDAPSLSRETFLDAHVYPRRTRNYFAVPDKRRAEIRDRARRILGIG